MAAWQDEVKAPAKLAVQRSIAEHLGWSDLHADTWNIEKKFNIWFFYDPTLGPRDVKSRDVRLKYPLTR